MASQCPPTGKSSWPELVGTNVNFAEGTIMEQNSNIGQVEIVPVDHKSGDIGIDCNRVILFVDESGNVAKTPTIG